MRKTTSLVLMLCFILSGAFSYAHGVDRTDKKGDGIPVEIKEKTNVGHLDRSSSILVSIDGHVLSVVFTENLGQVNIDITTDSGATEATLEVSDLLGTTVAAYRIDAGGGQKVLDLRSLPAGVYMVTLRCQGLRRSEKLVIAR